MKKRIFKLSFLLFSSFLGISSPHAQSVVTSVEGSEIIVDHKGIFYSNGERIEVFNYDGKRIAVLRVENQPSESPLFTCKKLSGGEIRPGYSVKKRIFLPYAAVIGFSSLPIKTEPNAQYTQVAGQAGKAATNSAKSFYLGFIYSSKMPLLPLVRLPSQFLFEYHDLGVFKAFGLFLGVGPKLEVVYEKVFLEIGGGVGITGLGSSLKWARPAGTYSDSIATNSGKAGFELPMVTYRAWAGLSYQFTREVGLQLQYGFFGLSGDNFYDSNIPKGATSGKYKIADNWLESNITKKGGPSINLSLAIWFKG